MDGTRERMGSEHVYRFILAHEAKKKLEGNPTPGTKKTAEELNVFEQAVKRARIWGEKNSLDLTDRLYDHKSELLAKFAVVEEAAFENLYVEQGHRDGLIKSGKNPGAGMTKAINAALNVVRFRAEFICDRPKNTGKEIVLLFKGREMENSL